MKTNNLFKLGLKYFLNNKISYLKKKEGKLNNLYSLNKKLIKKEEIEDRKKEEIELIKIIN